MPRDRVQRHGERVGEHGDLVGETVGHRDRLGVVRGEQLGEPARGVARVAGVDPGCETAAGEVPALGVVTARARRAHGRDPAGRARQPALQHDALTGFEVAYLGTDLLDVGDDFVPQDLREGDEGRHREVGGFTAHVHEHLLGVRSADAGETRAEHDPVGRAERRLGHVLERHRRGREPVEQRVRRRVTRQRRELAGVDAEDERLHAPSPCVGALSSPMSATNASVSAVLFTTTSCCSPKPPGISGGT